MSQHFFMVGKGHVSPSLAARLDTIAGKHDAEFVSVDLPGEGPRFWFACPNLGAPFDAQTERAVRDALQGAGLLDPDGRLRLS